MSSFNLDTGQEMFQIRGMARPDRNENARDNRPARDNARDDGFRQHSNNTSRRNGFDQIYRGRRDVDRYGGDSRRRSRSPSMDYRNDNRGRELFADNTTRPRPDRKENIPTNDVESRMDIDDESPRDGKPSGLAEVVNGVRAAAAGLKSQQELFQDHQRNRSQTRYRQRDVSRGTTLDLRRRSRSRSSRRQQRGRSPARYPPAPPPQHEERRRRYPSRNRSPSLRRVTHHKSHYHSPPRVTFPQWWNSRLSPQQNYREGWRLVPEDYRIILRDCVTPNFRITNLPLWKHDRTPLENMRLFINGMPERYMVEFGEFLDVIVEEQEERRGLGRSG